jgi:Bardet-Biedl syndrome 1 protein
MSTQEPITNLERLDLKGQREAILILAALTNGDVRMYRGKDLVDVLRVGERIAALACGPYSREVNTLCLVTKAGGLIVKMLPRRHELATATYGGGPPPEQDIPLDIPKKTKLYLDQTEREREMAPEMHRRFQQETVNLQVTTAKAYLELLQRGEIAGASVATEKKEETKEEEDKVLVDLRAVVKGLGPFFHLEVEVANLGDESLLQIPILLSYNPEKYKAPKPLIQIGALVPGVPLKCIFELECLDPSATDEEVEIQVLPSQLEDVLRETDRLESDVNFSALVMSRVTMPQSSML